MRHLTTLLLAAAIPTLTALAVALPAQAQLVVGGPTLYVADRDAGVLAVQSGTGAVTLVTDAIRPEQVVGGAGTLYAIDSAQVHRVDTATGSVTPLPGVLAGGHHVDIAPDGQHLIVTHIDTVERVSLTGGGRQTICGPLPVNDQPWVAATARPDGSVIAWAHDYPGGDVYSWTAAGGCQLVPGNPYLTYTQGNGVTGSSGYAGLAATADGALLFSNGGLVGADDGRVSRSGTGQIATLADPGSIAVAADGAAYVLERNPDDPASAGEVWAIPPGESQRRVAHDDGGAGLFQSPASITALCRWGGCVQATPQPVPPTGSDRTAKPAIGLTLAASGKRKHARLTGRKLRFPAVRCQRACTVTLGGKVKIAGRRKALALPRTTRKVAAGKSRAVTVKLPRKLVRTVSSALAAKRKVTARIVLSARSPGAKPARRTFALRVRR